jgi:hypothetical protein
MSQPDNKKRTYWMLTIIFTVITVGMLFVLPEWFWVPLPFMLTYGVYAMDVV